MLNSKLYARNRAHLTFPVTLAHSRALSVECVTRRGPPPAGLILPIMLRNAIMGDFLMWRPKERHPNPALLDVPCGTRTFGNCTL